MTEKLPKKFKVEFTDHERGSARTLYAENGKLENGWTIDAEIHEDYYEWINYFVATHEEYGTVWGDFEDVVYASSKKAYEQFLKDNPYEEWDYGDI